MSAPTRTQELGIEPILNGKDILLIAPTGTGKTEACVLPLFHNFIEHWSGEVIEPRGPSKTKRDQPRKHRGISILYITPLRALNRDMLARLKSWGEQLGIAVAVRHGDTTQKERTRQSKYPPNILITTPETLQILLISKNLSKHLQYVRAVVVDEIHELAQEERGAQLAVALERLEGITTQPPQRIGLSATVGTPEEIARFLEGAATGRKADIIKVSIVKDMEITVESPEPTKEDWVDSEKLAAEPKSIACMRRINDIITTHRSVLVFINTRDGAESLAARFKLWDKDIPVGVHHGSLSRSVRIQMEDDFKQEKLKGLICTSSLELGIDIGSADFTVQYNSPREVTRLVQRIGRSGHKLGRISKGSVITTHPDEIAESMVITRRALNEELEPVVIRQKMLSVLANQLAAFSMQNKRNDIEKTYQKIQRAYPFRNLAKEEYLSVLGQMREIHAIWLDNDEFGRKSNTIEYFFDNISMIPDEKSYRIFDITTRQHVGQLDDGFVSIYLAPLAKFIIKGESWRVVEVKDDDRILVEPASEVGAVPGWIGEEIPVPFEVAQEVGKLRGEIAVIISNLTSKQSEALETQELPEPFNELLARYPIDKKSFQLYVNYIYTQSRKFLVPTDRLITIDATMVPEPIVIINACFGSKLNETIGQVISALVASRIGASVGVRTDPYRIILELSARIKPKVVEEYLLSIDPNELEPLMRLVLKNSSYLKHQLLHVGRKFGAIKKDVDHKQISLPRLLDSFKNSPLYDEAINKLLWEKMDVPRTGEILTQIQKGEFEVKFSPLSPISQAGLETRRDLMAPEKADRTILAALKRRLEGEYVRLVCLNCKRTQRRMIQDLDDKIKCNHCNGVLLAVIPLNDVESVKLLKSTKKPNADERRMLKRLRTNANLVMSHGKRAVLALAARGVGSNTAARILARQQEDELELLRDILKAEITYARTKRFWD
ncbi:DEAD/DEAH box helicase [[Eubacterium] cellulosolvens]